MSILNFLFSKKSRLKVVQDYDFINYLKRIGLLESVKSGQKFCRSCGIRITLDNIQAIIPVDSSDGSVVFICDKASCLKQTDD